MSWRDTLLPATFRGVPFEVESADTRGGRKLAIHEYPQSDRNEVEDLGQGPRRFALEAFVVGDDYATRRDALEAALDAPGAGTLVHPFRGDLRVVIQQYSVREGTREGGNCASFRFECVLDTSPVLPGAVPDAEAETARISAEANGTAAGRFGEAFQTPDAGDRAWGLSAITEALKPVSNAIKSIRKGADSIYNDVLEEVLDPLAGAKRTLEDLIDLPGDLGQRIAGMVGNIERATDLSTLFDGYHSVSRRAGSSVKVQPATDAAGAPLPATRSEPEVPPAETARDRANRDAMLNLFIIAIAVRHAEVALVEISRGDSSGLYPSYDAAISGISRITEQIDIAGEQADDATFDRLQALRTVVVEALTRRAADLARVARLTANETLPSLVLAHQLYGPANVAANADDIAGRNNATAPGFVGGGSTVEALTA